MTLKIVPELYCFDIEVSKRFYQDILGFEIQYERPEEQFAYLSLDGVDLMLEGLYGQGRRWLTGEMEKPFGRGINFQWDTLNLEEMVARVKSLSPDSIFLEFEAKSYQVGDKIVIQKQFVVQDPDGYLFRFCEAID
ncbi:MAG: bleomycin resistance protein [Anaerolineae bacterium]